MPDRGTDARREGPFPEGVARAVGVNYHLSSAKTSLEQWVHYDGLLAEEQIGFLAENGLDTIRSFLNFDVFETDPSRFLADLYHFAAQTAAHRMLFVAVLFDSFGQEPSGDPVLDAESPQWIKSPGTATLSAPDFPARALAYVEAVVGTVNQALLDSGEPGLWWVADLWNEPHLPTVTHALLARLLDDLRAQADPPRTTVGFAEFSSNADLLAELGDHEALTILSGHPYGVFAEVVVNEVAAARALGDTYGGKEVFVSEIGLPGLFQYYGNVLRWLETADVGFALWEAFVGNDQFRNLTGVFYPEPIVDGMVTVRCTTAANALWALAGRRNPGFLPPYVAREKPLEPGYVSLGPGAVDLSTGAYHELLADHQAHYGTARFPLLSLDAPGTGELYSKLMTWTFLSFDRILTVDGPTEIFARQNLVALKEQYAAGNLALAEAALFNLFGLASELMADNGLGEPPDYPPEVLSAVLTATPNGDGRTFDAHFETVVFDVDKGPLSVWLFARAVGASEVLELPLTVRTGTTAHVCDVGDIALTHGREVELAVFVVDHEGGKDLRVVTATLP